MQSCMLDFDLTDDGTFRLKQFGEQTGPEILAKAYPVLKKALEGEEFAEHASDEQTEPQKYGLAATEPGRRLACSPDCRALQSFLLIPLDSIPKYRI